MKDRIDCFDNCYPSLQIEFSFLHRYNWKQFFISILANLNSHIFYFQKNLLFKHDKHTLFDRTRKRIFVSQYMWIDTIANNGNDFELVGDEYYLKLTEPFDALVLSKP